MDLKKMKAVILAGGRGTRISEESVNRPKPMVTIGGMPIIWHIMKIYSFYGIKDFIICCGYKGEYIKKYFLEYNLLCNDAEFALSSDSYRILNGQFDKDNWNIILVNTGLNTLTAGRILRIKEYIGDDEEFLLTYGDGVADIDLESLVQFHYKARKVVTISTTQPEGRFGAIEIAEDGVVESFREKARRNQSFVNIGFMVMNRAVFDYLGDGNCMLENEPFERLAAEKQMAAYRHLGFWSPMDNVNDRSYLEKMWNNGAPWKLW